MTTTERPVARAIVTGVNSLRWGAPRRIPPANTRALPAPHIDCWRLVIESKGTLFSAEGGEELKVGAPSSCRYNRYHRPPAAECTCGYYGVVEGGFPQLESFFGGPTLAKFVVNGVLLWWTAQKADKYPVLMRVRLYDPWTDPHRPKEKTSYRGSRYDIIGPVLALTPASASRLDWLGVPITIVEDIKASTRSLLAALEA